MHSGEEGPGEENATTGTAVDEGKGRSGREGAESLEQRGERGGRTGEEGE